MNAGKSKVMVESSGEKLIVNYGKWSCGVCGKRVQANSVQCTVFKNWIGFRCKRCDGTIQEAALDEYLVVDGDKYGCVNNFCYLGDIVNGDGGADFAATARIRN